MARGDGDVLHAGSFSKGDPGGGIKFFGIEKCRQAIVFVDREMALVKDPFAVAEHTVDAPVDEQAEFHVLKFAAGLQIFGSGLVITALREPFTGGEDAAGYEGKTQSAFCNHEQPGCGCHYSFSGSCFQSLPG